MRALLIPALLAALALLAVVWGRWASPEAVSRRRLAREHAARDAHNAQVIARAAAAAAEEARIQEAWARDLYDPARDPFHPPPPAGDTPPDGGSGPLPPAPPAPAPRGARTHPSPSDDNRRRP